ncbi:hypothetical protein [Atlantibacter hermannii]|uniref:hypothetical protein n=1 Tax=Atlantibacter hermannii TaxID=565 RepID=UPI002FD9C3F7
MKTLLTSGCINQRGAGHCTNCIFFLALLVGILFNIGKKNSLVVFILAMLLPIATVFIFILFGGKVSFC